MALLGGGVGGAGNPVGGSFTGPAEALEIIGDHAYAYSGNFGALDTDQTLLQFQSGNFYFVGQIFVSGPCDPTGLGNGAISAFQLNLNDVLIWNIKIDTTEEDSPSFAVVPVIIPPYTEVKLTVISILEDSGRVTSSNITGKIFRTRD